MGDSNADPNFCDFNESRFLDEQVQGIKTLSDMVGQLNHVGEGT
jgi:ferritin heavy chain